MPLYEYLCETCGHRFENIQKFSDPPLEKCPKCGGHVHKMQAAPAFQFKGSGWYVTDYAKKSGSSASSDKTDSSAKAESADAKAEKADKSEKTEKADAKGENAAAKTEKADKKASGAESSKPPSS